MKNKIKHFDEIKHVPSGTNWKRVLLEIYRHSPHNYGESHKIGFYDNNHDLAKNLKITGYELGLAISFLREHKLIEDSSKFQPLDAKQINKDWNNRISLNEKGFEVASRLENQESNKKLQRLVILFTGIATLTGLILFLKDVLNLSGITKLFFYIIGILLTLIVM